tara:strand:+ start:18394 stop:19239 length:846 start_codon:yes stop_codon:yes gene_type:complete
MKEIYFIAEIGINHNGSIDICKKLIKVAKDAGCNAVKFQKRDIFSTYTKEFLEEPRESPWGHKQFDQKSGLEFGLEEYKIIDTYCQELGLDWFASAWDIKSQLFLRKFDLKKNKIASAMLVHKDLLELVAEEKKHTFISTGMSTYDDIAYAVDTFRKYNCPFELMHTVSTYPMLDEYANLKMIETLRKKFNCDVGYSGHEVGLAVSYAASALGITSLERHITLDRTMYGSDQSASIEPNGLTTLVRTVRKIEKAMGDGVKINLEEEKKISRKLRASIPGYK